MNKVEWITTPGLTPYEKAIAFMEARVEAIHQDQARECVWLLEHPPLYTAGTSADPRDLTDPGRFPVHQARRGGQYTYHGPGQRVAYVMLDLNRREKDVRRLSPGSRPGSSPRLPNSTSRARFGPAGSASGSHGPTRPRIPTARRARTRSPPSACKLRRWVSFHGISINVEPDLVAFRRHCPLRHPRPRGDQPCRPWPACDDGRS